MPDDSYRSDIMLWSRTQADRLRRVATGERVNDVDWEHVIEEVEDLGASELRAVKNLLVQAMLHGLECFAWPEHHSSGIGIRRSPPSSSTRRVDFSQACSNWWIRPHSTRGP